MRLGSTSAARMLPDTSIARMMVRCASGSVITASGRAIATSSVPMASSSSSGGTWRRQPGPLPSAALATARLARRTVLRRRLRSSHRYSSTSSGSSSSDHSSVGQMKVMHRAPAALQRRRRCAGAPASARRHLQPAALAAQGGKAQHRFEQVVVGGQLQRVGAGTRQRVAQRGFARLGLGRVALAEARVGGVDEQLLAGLGVFHRHQAQFGQRHLQRVEQAHRHHLVALRQPRQRVFPAGLADEVGHHQHQRAPLDRAGRGVQQLGQRGAAAARAWSRGRAAHALHQVQHMQARQARRQHGVDPRAVEHGADAVAVAREHARQQRRRSRWTRPAW